MTCAEKVVELREKIEAALVPIINRDYWLLEVPYYSNIGDTLIWQGEMDFLKKLPVKCKGVTSFETKDLPRIQNGDLVLFQGGGNFGDLWCSCHNYRKRIMRAFPRNQYIVFPQTVWYDDMKNCLEDAAFFADYDALICARDQFSYDFLKANFKNDVLRVPDMAFYMDMSYWNRSCKANRPLLLKRLDKEFKDSPGIKRLQNSGECDVSDWPTMMGRITLVERWKGRIRRRPRKLGWLYEPFMRHIYRPYLIREGVRFINSHTDIYTTRLHACILSVLLGKETITFFDNSYGKNINFYETWLRDCESIRMRG